MLSVLIFDLRDETKREEPNGSSLLYRPNRF